MIRAFSNTSSRKNILVVRKGLLSTKPSIEKKKEGGSSTLPLFFFLLAPALAAGGAAYKLENDDAFAKQAEARIPGVKNSLQPVTSILISTGLLKTKKPAEKILTVESPSKDIEEIRVVAENIQEPLVALPDSPSSVENAVVVTDDQVVIEAPVIDQEPVPEVAEDAVSEASKQSDITVAKSPVADELISSVPVPVILNAEDDGLLATVGSELRAKKIHSDSTTNVLKEQTEQSIALRNEIESTLLRDLHQLDEHALRVRVTQLAAELFERTKWEGVRLHQSLKQVEADLTRKYTDLMIQQRAELELELSKKLVQKEGELLEVASKKSQEAIIGHQAQLSTALQHQSEKFNETLKAELQQQQEKLVVEFEDQLNHFKAVTLQDYVKERVALQDKVELIAAQLKAFDKALDRVDAMKAESVNSHKQSAAVLALEAALTTSAPILKELNAVKSSASDPLIQAVVSSIPSTAVSKGVPTVNQLKTRFAVLRQELRKLALAPPNDKFLINDLTGYVVGSVLASISTPPAGYVEGTGVEEVLARSAYYLEQGRTAESLKELGSLDGYAKSVAADYVSLLKDRMVADQAAKALRANAILAHAALPN